MSQSEIIKPFNPLDKANLAKTVADQLLRQPLLPIPPLPFQGAGIYAIYYFGDHPLYEEITEVNNSHGAIWPIYVGKAIPKGGRKGGFDFDQKTGPQLFNRLREHSKSISEAENLNQENFRCRYLVVDSIWIPLGENLMIHEYAPLWNIFIDGFGNHDPGKGRRKQKVSAWDTLHPGRVWAQNLPSKISNVEDYKSQVRSWISEKKRVIFT